MDDTKQCPFRATVQCTCANTEKCGAWCKNWKEVKDEAQ